jgi:hypothetical protein
VSDYPIRVVVTDDRKRMRLAVLFRLILVLPHLVVLFFWAIVAFAIAVVNWVATLIMGRSPGALHGFLARFVRYVTHVSSYFFLLSNEYPLFSGSAGYAVDLDIDPPVSQRRWTVLVRGILALPALAISSALTGGSGGSSNSGGVLGAVGFLGWFACLARAEMPRGMRDLGVYSVGYTAQTWSYLFLLTDRYPNSDPSRIISPNPSSAHPVRLSVDDDRRRSRLTVFFRFLLAIPHFIWLYLWGIVALVAVLINWIVTLVGGRSPDGLHSFLVKYVRYQTHVSAYVMLVANRFPGFAGEPYDVDVDVGPSEPQNRWITGFRIILAIPTVIILGALYGAVALVALLGWFVSLIGGEMPEGLRNLGAYTLHYAAQVNAYFYVLTDAYPYSGPSGGAARASLGDGPAPELGTEATSSA